MGIYTQTTNTTNTKIYKPKNQYHTMKKTHQQILTQLQRTNPTIQQLSTTLQKNHNGIRGRVSELRTHLHNYTIKMKDHHYHLEPTLSFFKKTLQAHHQTNQPLTIAQLSITFNITKQSTETFLATNFTKLKITQLSHTTIKISF